MGLFGSSSSSRQPCSSRSPSRLVWALEPAASLEYSEPRGGGAGGGGGAGAGLGLVYWLLGLVTRGLFGSRGSLRLGSSW
jgi:hypothetical protein